MEYPDSGSSQMPEELETESLNWEQIRIDLGKLPEARNIPTTAPLKLLTKQYRNSLRFKDSFSAYSNTMPPQPRTRVIYRSHKLCICGIQKTIAKKRKRSSDSKLKRS